MRRPICAAGIGLALLTLTAAPLLAQGPPGNQGNGPPFCRSGQGHPVHGWEWCVAKGWAAGPQYGTPSRIQEWIEVVWEDARFREPARTRGNRRHQRRDREWMGRRELAQLAGDAVVRRIQEYGRSSRVAPGDRADPGMRGRWVRGDFEGVALEIQIGDVPVAYLHDPYERGRAESVFLRPGRR